MFVIHSVLCLWALERPDTVPECARQALRFRVPLRVLIELPLAGQTAKVVSLTLIFARASGSRRVHLHAANYVFFHLVTSFLCSGTLHLYYLITAIPNQRTG